jgi:hypothetical protein
MKESPPLSGLASIEETASLGRVDEIVDQWLADQFRGPHHVRALADPYDYICQAVQDLKRRLDQSQH